VWKNLALVELRVVTATMVQLFTAEITPGWDHANWMCDMTDRYSLIMPVTLRM